MPNGLLFIAATVHECGWIARGLGLRRVSLHRWEGPRAALEAVGIGARRTPAAPGRGVRVGVGRGGGAGGPPPPPPARGGAAGGGGGGGPPALDPALKRAQVLRWIDSPGAPPAPVVTAPAIVSSPEHKRALHQESGARAVDMEHSAVSTWAQANGACVEGCRVVLDLAGETLPSWFAPLTDDFGRVKWRSLALDVLLRPSRWLLLSRWARTSTHVGRALARAAARAADSPLEVPAASGPFGVASYAARSDLLPG
jgi:hypothetical protein